jgi:hypothetical protein
MQTDRFTKAVLSVIALSVVVLAGQNWSTTAHAATTRQAWEYKRLGRTFGMDRRSGTIAGVASLLEDGAVLPAGTDAGAKIAEFGSQGWELVSVTAYSQMAQTQSQSAESTLGPFVGQSMSGVTTADIWIFKRPKQ